MSWMEIARTGTFTDSAGRAQTFTAADLAAIAAACDPQKRDCPLVFGHPQSDSAPAFGWAQNIFRPGRLIVGKDVGDFLCQIAQCPGIGCLRHLAGDKPQGRLVSIRPCQRGGGGVTRGREAEEV